MNVAWVADEAVRMIHERQRVDRHRGSAVRDEAALRAALDHPKGLTVAGSPGVFDLAAAYAGAIIRNHPFMEGNARTAFVVSVAFLELNGQRLRATEEDAVDIFARFAAGELSEAELAEWFHRNAAPPDSEFLSPEQDQ